MILIGLLAMGLSETLDSTWEGLQHLITISSSQLWPSDIVVRVVHGETGAPVANADLYVLPDEGLLRLSELRNESVADLVERLGQNFKADELGEVRIQRSRERLRALAVHGDLSGVGFCHFGSPENRVTVLPCPQVSVRVKTETGDSIAGARVELRRLQSGCIRYSFYNERKTNARGETVFRIHELWKEEEEVYFNLLGIFPKTIQSDRVTFDTDLQALSLTAPPHGSLLIQVLPEAGCVLPPDGLRVLGYPCRHTDDNGWIKSVIHLPHAEVDAQLAQAQFNLVALNQEIWIRWGSNIPDGYRGEPIRITGPKHAGEKVVVQLQLSSLTLKKILEPDESQTDP